MPAVRFLQFAYRIVAYDGMLARRKEAADDKPDAPTPRTTTPAPAVSRQAPSGSGNGGLAALALNHPGLIERVVVPRKTPE